MGACFSNCIKAVSPSITGFTSRSVNRNGHDISSNSTNSSASISVPSRSEGEILQSSNLKSFSYSELRAATKRGEGVSSEKPITLSDKEEDSEDNEPIGKRLEKGGTSKPTAREKSPSSSATESLDVPSPPLSPAHSSPPSRIQQPSPMQHKGKGIKEIEAAPAAEEQVAEQEAQPQKKLDKGKVILVESPKKKKPIVPRQINLGGPLSYPVIHPDITGDEALARALVEKEGLEVPPLMEGQTTSAPYSSKTKDVIIRQALEEPPAASNNNQQQKNKPASPIASRKKSQIGIAVIFKMMGKKMKKLLPEKQSVPQIDLTDTTEELKALRKGLDQLSSSFIKFQEQQKEDREQLIDIIKASIKDISAAPSAPTLQVVRDEIKKASDSLTHAHSLHNTRAELQLRKLLLKNSEERKETKEALKAFGTYLEGRIYLLELRMWDVEAQLVQIRNGTIMMRSSIDHLVAVISDLQKHTEKWLLEAEVRRLRDQLRIRPPTQEETNATREAVTSAGEDTKLDKRGPQ